MILRPTPRRRGAVAALVAFMIVFLLAMVAFAVDVGYIAVVHKELQNAADAAALAGTSQVLDRGALKGAGNRTAVAAAARNEAQRISALNKGGTVTLNLDRNDANAADGDIVVGYLASPSNLGSSLDRNGPYNSVQVRVRRTAQQNGTLQLFFGPVLGRPTQDATATATATYEGGIRGFSFPGSGSATCKLIPFTLHVNLWADVVAGKGPDSWHYNPVTKVYQPGSDGVKEINLYPTKNITSGNFGTVDLGGSNNSTEVNRRQILYGPTAADLAAYGGPFELGADGTMNLGGDPGISAGMEDALLAIRGQPRIIPLFSSVSGNGNNTVYKVVAFAGIVITEVRLSGSNKVVIIQPEYVVDATAVGGGSTTTSYFVTKPLKLTR